MKQEFLSGNGDVLTRTVIEDGKVIQTRIQDTDPYLDHNKAVFNDAPGKFERKNRIQAVASIPMVAYFEIVVNKMGIPPHRMFQLTPDEKKVRNRWLNDPEYRYLRTSPGKI